MAINHLVMLNWKEGTTAAQTDELPATFDAMRRELGDLLLSFQAGPDAGLAAGNANFGIVASFRSEDDFATYMQHPAHRRVIGELSKSILASVSALQFVTD